jgi:anti-sigma B factor antagonist
MRPPPELKYELREEKTSFRLVVEGDIDLHVAPELRKILRKSIDRKPKVLVVDLERVPFLDSSAIATLVEALKLLRPASGVLRVENCQPAVRDTFDIAGLLEIFGISP